MSVIYIVTSGSYSDYRICSVWDNAEDAEREAAKFGTGWDSASVEEYVLNSHNTPHPPLWVASIRGSKGITVSDKAIGASDAGDIRTEVWENKEGTLWAHAYGISPEIATKNLTDALAKYRAEKDNL